MAHSKNLIVLVAASIGLVAGVTGQSCGCSADETCCSDSTGYACCIIQTTYCVQPNASRTKEFPARCCPQWTVGCQTGSVGCCDPARPWQRTLSTSEPDQKSKSTLSASVKGLKSGPTIYALFSANTANDLNALTIDSSTGAITKLVPVSGPAKDYFAKIYGEETRVFPFDPTRSKFFFIDIDQQTASPSSSITLYGIDPSTGESTSAVVSGATGFVMSFEYHAETATMIMAQSSRTSEDVKFYRVDLDTATATLVGTVSRGDDETSASFYGAYITALGRDGKSVYRLGYKEVSQGTSPGLGTVSITGSSPSTWQSVPPVRGEEFFYSLVRPKNSDKFLSLAPSASYNHTFAVVQWSENGTVNVVAVIADAHPPGSSAIGVLGYVADDANEMYYAAMTVQKHFSALPGFKDRWEVIAVDLASGRGTSIAITGQNFDPLGAETVSCSGVGIAA